MHMSDALISPQVGAGFALASGLLIAHSCSRLSRGTANSDIIPSMGVMGAFVFCAQMINFAIPGTGSSGHIGGGVLLTLLLGPHAAIVTLASVLIVQCFLFADGGILALGCNIFNLGFWPIVFCSWPRIRQLAFDDSTWKRYLVCILSVIASLELGASCVVLQTLLSGQTSLPLREFLVIMLGIHLPIAIAEGCLTAMVLYRLKDLLHTGWTPAPISGLSNPGWRASKYNLGSLKRLVALSCLIGTVGVWFASSDPDGLEWSIGESFQSASPTATHSFFEELQAKTSFLPDYNFPVNTQEIASLENESAQAWPNIDAGTSVAGAVGGLVTGIMIIALGFGLAWINKKVLVDER